VSVGTLVAPGSAGLDRPDSGRDSAPAILDA